MEVDECTVLMKLYECVGDMVTELACGQLPLHPLISIHYKDKGPSSAALLFPPCLYVMWCGSLLTSCLFTLGLLALHIYEYPSLLRCVCVVVCDNCIPYLVCANV